MSEDHIGMPESSIESTHSSSNGPYNLHGNALILTVLGIVVFILVLLSFHYKHRLRRGRGRARLQFAVADNSGGGGTEASPTCKGLDDSVLQALPLFSFDPEWAQQEGGFGGGGNGSGAEWQCAVCLNLLEGGDEVRLLPRCMHAFHAACIDLWFRSHSDCPLCRQRVCDGDSDSDNSGKNTTDAAEAVAVHIGELGDSASTTTTNNDEASATAMTTVTTMPRSCLKVAIFEVDHGT